jgi:PAS domain S-box-containing protein
MTVDILEVRRALEGDQIVPCFQPLVDLHSGVLTGFEILARWQHPEFGLVLPHNFIALTEENGLAGQLMQQVLRHALRSAYLLPEPLGLSVNVSPTQLQDFDLPRQIRVLTEEAGFSMERLTVEITETALVNNLEMAAAITRTLKAMGCSIALDDFGTGYSSLSHLNALPFDELKIDRSFISSMATSRQSRKIVAAIVGLGHSLSITTVAEGIETEDQACKLLWLGCELGQGWLYGRPLPAESLPSVIAAQPHTLMAKASMQDDNPEQADMEALPTLRRPQLQAIYDGAPVGLCFLDRNLRYVSLNRRLAAIHGASIAAHLGRTVQEMIPASFPEVEPYLLRALNGEAVAEVEITKTSVAAGGTSRTMLASYQPAWDEAHEVVGVSIVAMDITEHKRAAEALRESEDLHRQMYELNPQVPWIMDPEGKNLKVNARWVEATGVGKDWSESFSWIEALHPGDMVSTRRTMKQSLQTGTPIDIRYRVKNAEGEWTWKRSRGTPRFGPKGEITRWYGIVENVAAFA